MRQTVRHLINHIHYTFVCVHVFVCLLCIYLAMMFVYHACIYHLPLCMCTCVVPYRKTITVRILDREEYNKLSSFHILLEPPQWRRNRKEQTGVTTNEH